MSTALARFERFGVDSIGKSKFCLLGDISCVNASAGNKKCVELLSRELCVPVLSSVDLSYEFHAECDVAGFAATGDSGARPSYIEEFVTVYILSAHDLAAHIADRQVQLHQMGASRLCKVAVVVLPDVQGGAAAAQQALAETEGVHVIDCGAVAGQEAGDEGAAAFVAAVGPALWRFASSTGLLSGGVTVHCWGDSLCSPEMCGEIMSTLPHGDGDGGHRLAFPVQQYADASKTSVDIRQEMERAYASGAQDARGGAKHDFIVIACGQNDVAANVDYKRLYSNIKLMAQAALEREQRLVIVGVPSNRTAAHNDAYKNLLNINKALKKIAGDAGLALAHYIDTLNLTGEDAGHHVLRLQQQYASEDGTQLNAAGRAVVGKAVAEAVRDLHTRQTSVLPKTTKEDFERRYEMGKLLGKGGFGTVYLATQRHTGRQVAVKVIDKATKITSAKSVVDLHRELSIQASLKHPCIVELIESCHTTENVYIIMECCDGGDLHKPTASGFFERDENHGQLRRYFQHLISALRYMHRQRVAHRDIKHANVIKVTEGDVCKVTDFGLSKSLEAGDLSTYSGTKQYFAPELLRAARSNYVASHGGDGAALPVATYGLECDVWSCGVYLYCLLSAQYPFDSPEQTVRGTFSFKHGLEQKHPQACALVRKMLVVDPKRRITIDEIFQDPWFKVDLESNPAAMSEGTLVASPGSPIVEAGGGAAAGFQ